MNLTNYMEKGQTISGRIKGFFGGNVKKGPICILAPKQNIIATTTTDEKGEFIVNTSFRDSTTFLVQARTKRGFAAKNNIRDFLHILLSRRSIEDSIRYCQQANPGGYSFCR